MELENRSIREPIAIIVAPNGARKTKYDHASLPMTSDSLCNQFVCCHG